MICLCDFHTKVLGCSHKGDRWAVKKMGLATACPREKERDVYHSADTHAPSQTVVVQLCSVYHVWRKKVNKRFKELERTRESLQC